MLTKLKKIFGNIYYHSKCLLPGRKRIPKEIQDELSKLRRDINTLDSTNTMRRKIYGVIETIDDVDVKYIRDYLMKTRQTRLTTIEREYNI